MKWDVVTDTVDLESAGTVRRDVVRHCGAVGVVALDDADRVLLLRQYRHPVAALLWELPAGLLDTDGEQPLQAAQRELAEEAGLVASSWATLLDMFSSPGMSGEAYRIYLARGIGEVAADRRHQGIEEEADLLLRWVRLEDAVTAVLRGAVHNAMAACGLLAAQHGRASGWRTLRSAQATWPFLGDETSLTG